MPTDPNELSEVRPVDVGQSPDAAADRAAIFGPAVGAAAAISAREDADYVFSGGAPFDRLAASTYTGLIKDPGRAARVLKLRDQLRLPSDLVDRNLDNLEKEITRKGFNADEFRKSSPLVAEWIAQDSDHAGLSHDDLPRLAALEKFVADSPNFKYDSDGSIIEITPQGERPIRSSYYGSDPTKSIRALYREIQKGRADYQAAIDKYKSQQESSFLTGFRSSVASSLAAPAKLMASTRAGLPFSDFVQGAIENEQAAKLLQEASSFNNPGFWSDLARGAGGLAADAPLMLAGSALVPMAGLRTAFGASQLGKVGAGVAAAGIASQPLSLREGINVGTEHGWANGLVAWGIETGVTGAFGLTGQEKIITSLLGRGVAKESAPTLSAAALGLLKQSGLEATEESVTELAHALHEQVSGIDPTALNTDKLTRRLVVAGALGSLAGGAFNAPAFVAQAMKRPVPVDQTLKQTIAALSTVNVVENMVQAASESTTGQRYEPEAKRLFQSILSNQEKFPEVFIDHDAWVKLTTDAKLDPRNAALELLAGPAQDPTQFVDPRKAKASAEAAAAYDEAARTGGQIRVKTADLAFWLASRSKTAEGKQFSTLVTGELRADPMAMNGREVNELFAANEPQPQEPAIGEVEKAETQQVADIKAEIESALVAAGYEQKTAASNAEVESKFWRAVAAQYNRGKAAGDPSRVTPAQLWKEWNVQIQRPAAGVLTEPTSATPDQIVAEGLAKQKEAAIDAEVAKANATNLEKLNAEERAKLDLVKRGEGEEGAKLIEEALKLIANDTKLFKRRLGTGDVLRALGPDFGFRADSKQKLSVEQIERGKVFLYAMQSRGVDFDAMADDAVEMVGIKLKQTETAEDVTATLESWIASQPPDVQAVARSYLPQIDVQNDPAGALANLQQVTLMGMPRGRRKEQAYEQPKFQSLDSVRNAWEEAGISGFISEKDDVITVGKIVVPEKERGSGKGTAAMRSLIAYADANGKRIALSPSPDFGGTKSRLEKFYKGLGFVSNTGKSRDFSISETMVREPVSGKYEQRTFGISPLPPTIEIDGKQRPTTNSNGQPIAATEEGVRNFWKWFGDSKVVDEQGRPLVVYHGTKGEFDVFDGQKAGKSDPGLVGKAFYFTPIERQARNIAESNLYGQGTSPNVMAVYVATGNPAEFVNGELVDGTSIGDLHPEGLTKKSAAAARKRFTSAGNDGVVFYDRSPSGQSSISQVAVFSPTQIKSATGNRGTFDPAEASILRQRTFGMIDFQGAPGSRRTVISLFDIANLSTFMHESAHLHLEVLFDLASREGASPEIKADFAAAVEYLGKDVEAVRNESYRYVNASNLSDAQKQAKINEIARMSDEQIRNGYKTNDYIRTAFHERWARSWEAYLMEGRAPTPEVRSIFARFAAWLSAVYKEGVRRLGVTLTPEIRSVMDRMVATQEEIDQARNVIGDDGFSTHAKAMGLTDAQAEAISTINQQALERAESDLLAENMRAIKREQYKYYQELKAKMRAEVAAEVHQDRTYIAQSVLKRGKTPDGQPNKTTPKLSSAAVKKYLSIKYGGDEARMKADRERLRGMISVENGLDLDAAAITFGFPSGNDLMNALTTVRDMDQVIDAITADRMREKYGDPLLDGTATDKAMEAMHGDQIADVHEAKIKALAKRVGKRAAPVEVMRQAAQERIAMAKAGDLRPSMYLSAEIKARRQVQQALARQDWEAALTAKQAELLNHELYKAAQEAKANVKKAVEYARSFDEKATRQRIGKAGGWEYTVTAPDGTQTIFVSKDEAEAFANRIGGIYANTSGYLESIDEVRGHYALNRTPRQANRARTLQAWLEQEREEGSVITIDPRLLDDAARMDWRDATVEDLLAMADTLHHLASMASKKNQLSIASAKRDFAELRDDLVAQLQDSHPKFTKPKAEVKVSETNAAARFLSAHKKLAAIARSMDGGKDLGPFQRALLDPINTASDRKFIMLGEALDKQRAMWAEWDEAVKNDAWGENDKKPFDGFEGGLTRKGAIMVALNWGNPTNQNRLMVGQGVTPQQVQAVLDSLESADWNLIEKVWEHIDSYWPAIAALEQRFRGVPPEKVEAVPFDTRLGTQRGGYFPIVYNTKDAPSTYSVDGSLMGQIAGMPNSRPQTKDGHTKERAQGGTRNPLMLDPAVIGRHLNTVIHDLTHREAVRDVAKILSDRVLGAEIVGRMGAADYLQAKAWLLDVASDNARNRDSTGAQFISSLRKGFSFSTMSFRPSTAALQITGFSNAASRVGLGYMTGAISRMYGTTNGVPTFQFIQESSEFMRTRNRTMTQEMSEIYEGQKSKLIPSGVLTFTDKYGFWMMRQVQSRVDNLTWIASYTKAIDGGRTHEDAVKIANQDVIDTQGSGLIKDLSGVQRSVALQLFSAAYTYGSILFNQYHGIAANFRQDLKQSFMRAFVRAFTGTILTTALPAAMSLLIRELIRKQPEEKKDPLAQRYANEVLSNVLGTMIGARELTGALQGYPYEGPAGVRPIAGVIDLVNQARQLEADAGLARAANDAIGGIFGLPSAQVWAMVTGLDYLLENPSIDLRPIFTGPPPKN